MADFFHTILHRRCKAPPAPLLVERLILNASRVDTEFLLQEMREIFPEGHFKIGYSGGPDDPIALQSLEERIIVSVPSHLSDDQRKRLERIEAKAKRSLTWRPVAETDTAADESEVEQQNGLERA